MHTLKKCLALAGICCLLLSCKQDLTDWQHLDLQKNNVWGISSDKAYEELLKDQNAVPIIVAVLDGGVDLSHEELNKVLWVNQTEKPGNQIDDDGNGYVDDLNGWNFLGSPSGSVKYDNMAITRKVQEGRKVFGTKKINEIPQAQRADFIAFHKWEIELEKEIRSSEEMLSKLKRVQVTLDEMLRRKSKDSFSLKEIQQLVPLNDAENQVRSLLNVKLKTKTFKEAYQEDILERTEQLNNRIRYHFNVGYTSRNLVNDHPENDEEKGYGNADVQGPDNQHGTHVAGIIAADRENRKGIRGISDHAEIMVVRMTPNGDERDKDVANAIRYAAENGAKIINMSFGKYVSENKRAVDEAVQFALKKGVLLIKAAGNDNKNLDEIESYPNPQFPDGITADAWITVGASNQTAEETLKAEFSNYGIQSVDVFAPGVRICSAIPGNLFRRLDGTSMAAPVVSGLAAMIWSYFPEFTAMEVKNIILQSVVRHESLVKRCVTGGVVNAYNAIQLAKGLHQQKMKNK